MTIDELAEKMDSRFDKLDGKVDNIATTVAVHGKQLQDHDEENKTFHKILAAFGERIMKLEKWQWFMIGAGGAAGAGIAKLFM